MSGANIATGRLALMLTTLRLPTIKRLSEPMCEQCDREGWPARRLLEALFEHELAEGHEWLDRGANVLLFGPPGVGKSHLVSALGHALIDAGRRVLFTRCGDLVQRLQAARRDLRLPQELTKLDRFDLLILDDLSYVRRDQAETSVLFELIAERYEHRSLAVTANTPFSQWGEVFAEPAMTLAAVDRLVHHATILEMNVQSYRRRAAQTESALARRARSKATTTKTAEAHT